MDSMYFIIIPIIVATILILLLWLPLRLYLRITFNGTQRIVNIKIKIPQILLYISIIHKFDVPGIKINGIKISFHHRSPKKVKKKAMKSLKKKCSDALSRISDLKKLKQILKPITLENLSFVAETAFADPSITGIIWGLYAFLLPVKQGLPENIIFDIKPSFINQNCIGFLDIIVKFQIINLLTALRIVRIK